jgi:predicted ATPase/DNA-binding SARP family transcriptional activator
VQLTGRLAARRVLDLRILGPLEVRHDGGTLQVGSPRNRALLAALLVHRGEPVAADALVQALWGDEAPRTAAKALHVQVSRLRRALGPAAERLQTTGGGYRLLVESDELDADRFARGYDRGRALLAAGRPAEAVTALGDTLALWRGPPLADVRYHSFAQAEIRRLEELRATALEERIEAELALGEHARVVGELEALVAEHPLRERLRAQQMLALYRSGRHADALAVFRDARVWLGGELGLEPGPELRALEQAILTHDPSLAAPEDRNRFVPAPPTPTFGRDDDVRGVLTELERTRMLTLTGPGGVGKTRLAVEVARAAGGRFVSLASTVDAKRIPAVICDALAVTRIPGEADTEAADRALDREPMLLVLDNLEHLPDAAPLVAGLLERHPDLTLLATSRQPVRIQAERLYPVAPLALGSDSSPAVALFADRAQARDPSFALTAENTPAVAAVCERVAGLPLAIELAAARLGVLTPADLAKRLSDVLALLDQGPRDAPERQRTLRATLDWSFDLLDAPERDAFTALGAFASGCDLEAAEAVTRSSLPVLEGLVAKSLVNARSGRLELLEIVRQYAAQRLAARPDADVIRARHFAHFLGLAERTEYELWVLRRSSPAFAVMHREHDNLEAALEWSFAAGRQLDALTLAGALGSYMWLAHAGEQARRWYPRALTAAGPDAPPRLRARAILAWADNAPPGTSDLEHLIAAVELFRQLDDDVGIVRSLASVSNALSFGGDYEGGRRAAEQALTSARRTGDPFLTGEALAQIALGTPRIEEALPFIREAVALFRAAGALERMVGLLSTAGMAALREDAYDRADELEREALEAALEIGDPVSLAYVYGNTGLAALLGGNHDAAWTAFRDELATAHAHRLDIFYSEGLLGLAALTAARGDDRRAGVLEAAAGAVTSIPVGPSEVPVYERLKQRFIAPARERLGQERWAEASAVGRGMSADAAIGFALEAPTLKRRLPD